MSNKEEQLEQLMQWATQRLDDIYTTQPKDALALEEEFFDWYNDQHQGNQSNVLFVPYHESIN